ncbi:MAG: hypothetical protein LBU48_06005 [Coriobacteriales bacterium]|nr:hypothetical protein [Coriobacteriales bacterium]
MLLFGLFPNFGLAEVPEEFVPGTSAKTDKTAAAEESAKQEIPETPAPAELTPKEPAPAPEEQTPASAESTLKALEAPVDSPASTPAAVSAVAISTTGDSAMGLLTGDSKTITYTYSRPVAEDAVIYVPLPEIAQWNSASRTDGSFVATNGVSGSWHSALAAASTEVVTNHTFIHEGATITGDFFKVSIAKVPGDEGSSDSLLGVSYRFANGTTVPGTELPITAYISAGSESAKAADKKLVATIDESWSIEKSIESTSEDFAAGEFLPRPFAQVGNHDSFDITYKLSLKTTGVDENGVSKTAGRLFQNGLRVTDTLSDSAGGNAPTIKEIRLDNPTTGSLITPDSFANGVLKFTVPSAGAAVATNNLAVYVTVSVDKDAYTMLANGILPSSLYALSNQARLTSSYAFSNAVKPGNYVVSVDRSALDTSAYQYRWTEAYKASVELELNSDVIPVNGAMGAIAAAYGLLAYNESVENIDAGVVPYTPPADPDEPGDPDEPDVVAATA